MSTVWAFGVQIGEFVEAYQCRQTFENSYKRRNRTSRGNFYFIQTTEGGKTSEESGTNASFVFGFEIRPKIQINRPFLSAVEGKNVALWNQLRRNYWATSGKFLTTGNDPILQAFLFRIRRTRRDSGIRYDTAIWVPFPRIINLRKYHLSDYTFRVFSPSSFFGDVMFARTSLLRGLAESLKVSFGRFCLHNVTSSVTIRVKVVWELETR